MIMKLFNVKKRIQKIINKNKDKKEKVKVVEKQLTEKEENDLIKVSFVENIEKELKTIKDQIRDIQIRVK